MLSIGKIKASTGGVDYWTDLAREDYYVKGGEPPGKWILSSDTLQLQGRVQKEDLAKLFQGYDPNTNKKLVQNAGKEKRTMGIDFCFSSPKSVSVVWSVADTDLRQKIQSAQQKAVEKTVVFMSNYALTRRGKGGIESERPKSIFAASFEHSTSREQDMQLHTHVLVANVCERQDGSFGTLDYGDMMRMKKALGAMYRSELASELQKMGFSIERDGDSFHIAGVDKSICKHFIKIIFQFTFYL